MSVRVRGHSVVRPHRFLPASLPHICSLQPTHLGQPQAEASSHARLLCLPLHLSSCSQLPPSSDFSPAPSWPHLPSLVPRHGNSIDTHSHPGSHSAANQQNDVTLLRCLPTQPDFTFSQLPDQQPVTPPSRTTLLSRKLSLTLDQTRTPTTQPRGQVLL